MLNLLSLFTIIYRNFVHYNYSLCIEKRHLKTLESLILEYFHLKKKICFCSSWIWQVFSDLKNSVDDILFI